VADLDELDLINAIQSLQNGVDLAGFSLNGSPEFTTGCTLGAFAIDKRWIRNLKSLKKRVAAGARVRRHPAGIRCGASLPLAWRRLPPWMCR
jgi:methylenetetrahydrofolate reductase (NADPH)